MLPRRRTTAVPVDLDERGAACHGMCYLFNQKLAVSSTLLDDTAIVSFTSYSQGVFGGHSRLAFRCPDCDRRVFSLFLPSPLSAVRPDGTANERRLACLHCHHLSYPSWRWTGKSRHRLESHKRRLEEKLSVNPAERPPGVSTTRHIRRFNRYMRVEGEILQLSQWWLDAFRARQSGA